MGNETSMCWYGNETCMYQYGNEIHVSEWDYHVSEWDLLYLYSQYFNARMCQLVLGAGAVEAVGLKTITARHLGEGS